MYNYPTKLILCALAVTACSAKPAITYKKAATVMRSAAYDERDDSLFSAPWPDDRQRKADGTVSFLRFPKPRSSSLFENVLQSAEGQVRGYGLQTPIYLPLRRPLAESSLDDTSVWLVVIDESSPLYGQHALIDWRQVTEPTLYLPGPTLIVRPRPGNPLEAKTKYALVVTTAVTDAAGGSVGPDIALFNALHEQAKSDEEKANAAFFAPLRAHLAHAKISPDQIAAASIFTTQPILDELQELSDFLTDLPDPTPTVSAHLPESAAYPEYDTFEGTYEAPFLQFGEVPFTLTGGEFRRDADGKPLIARVETMRFVITIPKGAVPEGGFPIVIYSHGTGGNYKSVLGPEAAGLASKGIAAVGIDQVLHGPRGPTDSTCFGNPSSYCFYNPVNVAAGRNNARQAALDNIFLQKMLRHLQIPTALDPTERTLTLRTSSFGFFGHSQGGLTGSLFATIAKDVDGFVLSGNGGWLAHTILVRTEPINLRALAEGPLLLNIEGIEALDEFHPVIALVQTLGEIADPNNYARWFKGTAEHPQSIYMTSGTEDVDTPPLGASQTAALAGLVPYAPLARDAALFTARGPTARAAPITATDGNTTAVFRQFAGYGHHAYLESDAAIANWQEFLDDLMHGRVPVIH